ncbi:peptide-methionine (S)-S-oxide reductase [Enterovibrio norvegicus FF-33]|uniref:Peptide methionine sulfoxide reductase MsrA n=1 Tax=Enterovibrio norvegicus FF-454 TaxID=1185651 RepID=A0A1E5C4U4_9GAMM|nr:peptide-methionine (S)-S-oxide reductase MsrA [Enterovibrio norvegicus]OEE60495.1 peptide-methionine (S)-S-oxide reductase [Enterovibrio norvegicus FF-454]OEE70971.1 peptide-methionine (S)-S-oxide reductase [Enterovibrio norvegicus FF-33]OEE83509.1 peptide-methionine (S)-S-oxide reductase [Enterovibrio norvegicus FF-162]
MLNNKQTTVTAEQALPNRSAEIIPADPHAVNGTSLSKSPSDGHAQILLAMGCFWGAERLFWKLDGVISTSVGYSGGFTVNPTYQDVCTAQTGHTEIVQVVYDPDNISLAAILTHFWQSHDPTQGMRQGNDVGTQYRSAIYYFDDEQKEAALSSKEAYQQALTSAGKSSDITTEIDVAGPYYFAETYHQQYLHKNPNGYCGIGGTGVCLPPWER